MFLLPTLPPLLLLTTQNSPLFRAEKDIERERERERGVGATVVRVKEREREEKNVRAKGCVRERERGRERENKCLKVMESVCVSERDERVIR